MPHIDNASTTAVESGSRFHRQYHRQSATAVSSISASKAGRELPAFLLLACLCLAALALEVNAQEQTQEDILFGTWALQPGLSTYLNSDPPQSEIRLYKPHEDGVEAIITTADANGVERVSGYIGDADGEPHPVYGLQNSDSITMQRQDRYTTLSTFSHAGNVTGTAERTISPSGTTMTVTVTINGEVIRKTVYEKVICE